MQTDNKLLDDLAKLATGAAGALTGVREEAEAAVKARVERMLTGLDLVGREEFEAVREMAALARQENEQLKARVAELEAALKRTAAKKTAARRRTGAAKTPAARRKAD